MNGFKKKIVHQIPFYETGNIYDFGVSSCKMQPIFTINLCTI